MEEHPLMQLVHPKYRWNRTIVVLSIFLVVEWYNESRSWIVSSVTSKVGGIVLMFAASERRICQRGWTLVSSCRIQSGP